MSTKITYRQAVNFMHKMAGAPVAAATTPPGPVTPKTTITAPQKKKKQPVRIPKPTFMEKITNSYDPYTKMNLSERVRSRIERLRGGSPNEGKDNSYKGMRNDLLSK